ncbi:MAG: zinc-finger domain-containing protein [Legionellaceae bacterium]
MPKLKESLAACTQKDVLVRRSELPLSCPRDDQALWNAHPKVYLPIEVTGVEACPYCGTSYILQDD